jgi:hypothetical protein
VTVHDRGPVQFIPGALALFNQSTFQTSDSAMLLISEEHRHRRSITYTFIHNAIFNRFQTRDVKRLKCCHCGEIL